jgi:hypothetical protein
MNHSPLTGRKIATSAFPIAGVVSLNRFIGTRTEGQSHKAGGAPRLLPIETLRMAIGCRISRVANHDAEGLPKEKFYNFSWSRDGKWLAFVRGQEIRNVVLFRRAK